MGDFLWEGERTYGNVCGFCSNFIDLMKLVDIFKGNIFTSRRFPGSGTSQPRLQCPYFHTFHQFYSYFIDALSTKHPRLSTQPPPPPPHHCDLCLGKYLAIPPCNQGQSCAGFRPPVRRSAGPPVRPHRYLRRVMALSAGSLPPLPVGGGSTGHLPAMNTARGAASMD